MAKEGKLLQCQELPKAFGQCMQLHELYEVDLLQCREQPDALWQRLRLLAIAEGLFSDRPRPGKLQGAVAVKQIFFVFASFSPKKCDLSFAREGCHVRTRPRRDHQ